MKIKVKEISYSEFLELPKEKRNKPKKPNVIFRTLVRVLSAIDLFMVRFRCKKVAMERLKKDEPCLILMNHSSFIDLKIAFDALYPRPFNIVSTLDSFVGKKWLMRQLGCIPTAKFVTDIALVKDMVFAAKELKSSILLYPEAGYSFDGTAIKLPESVGKIIKHLNIPVVMLTTYGAFHRDPLYNNLQLRKVKVEATLQYLLSPQEIQEKSLTEVNKIVQNAFSFDQFRWQQEHQIRICEDFRADGLNRVLYKCPNCKTEGLMEGKGIHLRCKSCKKSYTLDEFGQMAAENGEAEYPHIPDWYRWQRACVREEIQNEQYEMNVPVEIYAMKNSKAIYHLGSGTLHHNAQGFHLQGCDGLLDYVQKPTASYSLNADFYWYEIGDMISIGKADLLYYCFPKTDMDIVTKMRIAAEELYDLS